MRDIFPGQQYVSLAVDASRLSRLHYLTIHVVAAPGVQSSPHVIAGVLPAQPRFDNFDTCQKSVRFERCIGPFAQVANF